MQTGFGSNKESQADNALKRVYDAFSIDHVLRPRQTTAPAVSASGSRTSLTRTLLGAIVNNDLSSSQMPLLTLTGFAELCKIDCLSNPDKACNDLNTILRHYQLPIWRERGNVPRWALPATPVPQMMSRLYGAQAAMAQPTQNMMAAMQSAEEGREAANWIGQDVTYRKHYY